MKESEIKVRTGEVSQRARPVVKQTVVFTRGVPIERLPSGEQEWGVFLSSRDNYVSGKSAFEHITEKINEVIDRINKMNEVSPHDD